MLTLSSYNPCSTFSWSNSYNETFFNETLRLNIEFIHSLLSKNPLNTTCEGYWGILFMISWSFTAVSYAFFYITSYFYFLGVLIQAYSDFIFLFMVHSKSYLSLRKFGWLNILLALSLRDLWNPYMLSCLIKLLIFLCRKYLGKTIYWNLLMSLIIKSLPVGPQYIIFEWS
jgi:hypothetical protein